MKKVCILRSNPVSPDSRVEKIAYTLINAGYKVNIIGWDRDSEGVVNDYVSVLDIKVPITRIGYKASYGEGIKNIKSRMKFVVSMKKWLRKYKNEYDIVHACDFDTAFFCINQVRRMHKKIVFDIFDTISDEQKSMKGKILHCAERNVVNKSDAVIICTEERKVQLGSGIPKRLEVIHNSPIQSIVAQTDNEILVNNNDKVKIVYVGILQKWRLLKELLEFFKKNPQIEWYVGGFGLYEKEFKEASKKYDNIKFFGKIPYEKTISLEKQCDIMLAIYDPSLGNHKLAAPNKFYEALMLGKPVVMARGTGMSNVVKNNGIGVVIDYSEKGFCEGLKKILSHKNEWEQIGNKMKKIYSEQYSWDEMSKRLISLYDYLK